jgi:hypothetical protein
MGTRSLTYVYDENCEKIINLYRQFDGYPTGHGAELAEFLNSGRVVNGLDGMGKELQFNGSGCLAAQLVAHFKKESGGFYLHPVTVEDCGQDYEYHVYTGDEIRVKIMDCGWNVFGQTQDDTYEPLFEGNITQFKKYCASEQYDKVEINPPTNVFDNSKQGQDWLKSVLREGVKTVVFEKQDGTERVMKCTLSEDIIPLLDTTAVKQKKVPSPDVLAVWDTENNGWRSFRWDSIKSVTL